MRLIDDMQVLCARQRRMTHSVGCRCCTSYTRGWMRALRLHKRVYWCRPAVRTVAADRGPVMPVGQVDKDEGRKVMCADDGDVLGGVTVITAQRTAHARHGAITHVATVRPCAPAVC